MTREEVVERLAMIEREIAALRKALDEGWPQSSAADATQEFLEKCGGWQDSRSPEEIIEEIYSSRTSSRRATDLFDEGKG